MHRFEGAGHLIAEERPYADVVLDSTIPGWHARGTAAVARLAACARDAGLRCGSVDDAAERHPGRGEEDGMLRNLGERVQIILPEELNTYDVLVNDWCVLSKAALDTVVARLSGRATEEDGE